MRLACIKQRILQWYLKDPIYLLGVTIHERWLEEPEQEGFNVLLNTVSVRGAASWVSWCQISHCVPILDHSEEDEIPFAAENIPKLVEGIYIYPEESQEYSEKFFRANSTFCGPTTPSHNHQTFDRIYGMCTIFPQNYCLWITENQGTKD